MGSVRHVVTREALEMSGCAALAKDHLRRQWKEFKSSRQVATAQLARERRRGLVLQSFIISGTWVQHDTVLASRALRGEAKCSASPVLGRVPHCREYGGVVKGERGETR